MTVTALWIPHGYLAVTGDPDGPLVGYCCSGAEARIPGLAAEPGVCDIGVGMNPEFTGGGHGADFADAVLTHARAALGATALRAVVQTWNTRSLRLCRALGFTQTGTHTCVQDGRDVEYAVLRLG